MSVFTLDHSRQLAADAFRFHEERFGTPEEQIAAGKAYQPLVGKSLGRLA